MDGPDAYRASWSTGSCGASIALKGLPRRADPKLSAKLPMSLRMCLTLFEAEELFSTTKCWTRVKAPPKLYPKVLVRRLWEKPNHFAAYYLIDCKRQLEAQQEIQAAIPKKLSRIFHSKYGSR